ncbi:MAG: site-specific integrase [Endomicrobium sp.]|jgi:integrase|nr:site-specific integrase [Endomicrobium sp.]
MPAKLELRKGKYSFLYRDADYKQRRHTCQQKNYHKAKEEQLLFLAEETEKRKHLKGGIINPDTLSWELFCNMYVKFSRQTKDAPERDERTIKLINRILKPIYLKDITTDKLREYREERKKEGVKESSINREMNTVKNMFTYAIKEKNIPIKHQAAPIIPYPQMQVVRDKYFTSEEWTKMQREIKSESMLTVLFIMLYTATRLKEAMLMKWSHVLFNQDLVMIMPYKTRKSNPDPVYIPLHSNLKAYLLRLREKYPEPPEYIVKTSKETLNPIYSMSANIRKKLKELKIKGTAHTCRHTFISWAFMSGIDGLIIMDWARIKNIKVLNRYKHLSPDFKKDTINKITI